MSHCATITQARQEVWHKKMANCIVDHPQLASLPPTDASFKQNVLRSHFQLAIWYGTLKQDPPDMNPLDFGWMNRDNSSRLVPVMVPPGTIMAPPALLKLTKCGCKSKDKACKAGKCSCVNAIMACTLFCACKGHILCHNKFNQQEDHHN